MMKIIPGARIGAVSAAVPLAAPRKDRSRPAAAVRG